MTVSAAPGGGVIEGLLLPGEELFPVDIGRRPRRQINDRTRYRCTYAQIIFTTQCADQKPDRKSECIIMRRDA